MRRSRPALPRLLTLAAMLSTGALSMEAAKSDAADLSIVPGPYDVGGLFTRPLIPVEGEPLTIGLRAAVTGDAHGDVSAEVVLAAADGAAREYRVPLVRDGADLLGHLELKAPVNGLYTLSATLDAEGSITEDDATSNTAEIELPVVVAGRRPHFPWFGEQPGLRWATHWAGGYAHERTAHWLERGVLPLAWKWGTNLPGEWGEDEVYQMNADTGEAAGIAVDECGYYPTPEGIERFATYTRGMARAKRELPDSFFLMWHCGSFYPEQAALYRDACDLVVLESYVFRYAPQGLGTEQVYDFLDMKMAPARQVDVLGPTGSGPQVITSVDLDPGTFDRGMFEGVVRHLRQTWPEMRGLGLFGSCLGEAAEGQPRPGMDDNRFVDRLCHDYFILPVITLLPGNLWVSREDEGSWRVAAAVSNIGGTHSGPVKVKLYAGHELLHVAELPSIAAGDNRLENQVVVEVRWQATPGYHEFVAQVTEAPGSTVLESRAQMGRHIP